MIYLIIGLFCVNIIMFILIYNKLNEHGERLNIHSKTNNLFWKHINGDISCVHKLKPKKVKEYGTK